MKGIGLRIERSRWALFLCAAFHVSVAGATESQARQQVREGVEKHRAGDFAKAEAAFGKAAEQMPETPLILFDRACALAAQGKFDEAEPLFEQVRLRADGSLAAASLYNLGGIAAQRANTVFGTKPEDAAVEARQQGLAHLEQAVSRYRQCLALDPSHAEARHNLELLRVWIKNMQSIWQEKDRQKRRDELALLEFLEMIENEQRALRTSTQEAGGIPDSPKRRRAVSELADRQRRLQEEIGPLQEKIQAWPSETGKTDPSATATSPPTQVDPRLEDAIRALIGTAQESGQAMSKAAVDLAANSPVSAPGHQTQALAKLDEIYRVAAPFERLLQKAIQVEEKQIDDTQAMQAANGSNQRPPTSARSIVETQQQLVGWITSLTQKAESLLEQLPEPPMSPPASNDTAEKPSDEKSAGNTDAPPAESSSQEESETLQKAYARAIELGPQAAKIAADAANDASAGDWDQATTKEEQVVELLKKILDELPKPPQPPQQNEDSKKQEEKQPSDGEKDQQEQDKQQDESGSQQQEKKEDAKKEQGTGEVPSAKESDLDRRQAEALLRQVRQREREYKERQKEIQAILRGAVPVDKDW